MKNSKRKTKSRLQQIKMLEQKLAKNPDILKDIVFNPEKILPGLNFLDDDLLMNLRQINLFDLVTGLTGVFENVTGISNCGPASCGSGTCTSTCDNNSCTDTCHAPTCEGGATISCLATKSGNFDWGFILDNENYIKGLDTNFFKTYYR